MKSIKQKILPSRVSRRMAKLQDLKNAFKKNWLLFKESKIGTFGLGIILFFVIMGLLAPFLGLRDPVSEYADSRDICDVKLEWYKIVGNASLQPTLQYEQSLYYPSVEMLYIAVNDVGGSYVLAFKPPIEFGGEPSLLWTYPEPPETLPVINTSMFLNARGTLTLNDDVLYVIFENNISAVSADLRTEIEGGTAGKLLWWFNTDSSIPHPVGADFEMLLVSNRMSVAKFTDKPGLHRIYVGTSNGTLYALYDNHTDVISLWSLKVSSSPLYTPVASEDTVFCASEVGKLVAYYVDNSTERWNYSSEYHFSSSPTYDYANDILYIGDVSGGLHIVDANTGKGYREQLYLRPGLKDTGIVVKPAIKKSGEIIYVATSSQMFYAFWSDGNLKWNITLPGKPIGTPFFVEEYSNVYITTFDGKDSRIAGYSEGGRIQWIIKVSEKGNISSSPIVSEQEKVGGIGNVYTGSTDGCFRVYDVIGIYKAPLPPGNYKYSGWFLLGTDDMGRDILSQLVWGSRIALLVGISAAFFSVLIGVVIGLVAGYFGGSVDVVLMRFTDVILVLPALPLLIVLAALLGPNVWNIVFIIAIVGWPGTARVIRSEVLSLKERPFIESARVTGASHARIMFKHIAPNVVPLAFLFMTFGVTGAILAEASISFLGLGDPTCMSWGMMLNYLFQSGTVLTAWWWLIPPGLSITFVCLGFYLIGHAIEPIVNPRLRKR